MTLKGHILKEIQRKVRICRVEDNLSENDCLERIEEEYELEDDDKVEIRQMAKKIGKW